MWRWNLRLGFIVLLQVLFTTCSKDSSLTFVIDDTDSMNDVIQQVKNAAAEIMDIVLTAKASEIEDVVLVTFNDPADAQLRINTSSKYEFITALNEIKVGGGGDCPEKSMTGIKLALEESRHGSYLFVFTDDTAKDFELLNEVINLCEKKESQVIVILADSRCSYNVDYGVYIDIATACSGQVFPVPRHKTKDAVEMIKHILNDKKAVLTTVTVPASPDLTAIPFTVDDKIEYAIISTAGRNVELIVTDYREFVLVTEIIMWTPSGKVVKFNAPTPGTYNVWVRGDSKVSIVIYGRTDFTFEHGFSEFLPKSMSDTSKLPIANRKHHISISVVDPDNTVDIQSAEILNMAEQVITTMPLRKVNYGDFYITNAISLPSYMFKIQVTGRIIKTGKSIRRISKTAIEPPRPVSKPPIATIAEGPAANVNYDGDIMLTCKVTGYPTPEIVWTLENGTVLSRKVYEVEPPYEYISYLTLKHVTHAENYYCRASNKVARNIAIIYVQPRSPFTFDSSPAGTTFSKYGAKTDIACGFKSSFHHTIRWYKNVGSKKSEIYTSDQYTISSTGTILHIQPTDLNVIGSYTCEASLVEDVNVKLDFTTDVQISDLSPPVLQDAKPAKISVQNNDTVKITCKITSGTPPPVVSWHKMRKGNKVFQELPDSGQELFINSVTLQDAGLYLCNATNTKGHATKTTELVVQKAPEASIDKETAITVLYGSTTELNCKAVAYPPAQIVWRDDKGKKLTSKITNNNNEVISKLTVQNNKTSNTKYSCNAKNDLGATVASVQVTVSSPIYFTTNLPETTGVEYGAATTIICDVKSSRPIKIKWFYQKNVQSEKSEIHPSFMYMITPDEHQLHIKSVNLDRVGRYTCEAYLVSNKDENKSSSTNVKITNLKAPEIKYTNNTVTVMNGHAFLITCKITSGTPPPVVSWHKMRKGNKVFQELPDSGQELFINSVTLQDAGLYLCNATNTKGHATKTTELVVQKAPEASIDKETAITVLYGSTTELNCKAVAYPPAQIVWRDDKGKKLTSKITNNNNEVISKLTVQNNKTSNTKYSCNAKNDLGATVASVQVTVSSPIYFTTNLPETTGVEYGAATTIICDVKSSRPIKIKWLYQKNVQSEKSEIHPSFMYMITPDEHQLHIKSVDLDRVGRYTCEAYLVSNKDENKSFSTNVKITNLKAPEIIYTNNTVTVMNGHAFLITCKATGVPDPVITWQVQAKNSDNFEALKDSGQDFINSEISYEWAGLYKCTAASKIGTQNRTIEVIVHGKPNITNSELVYFGVTGDKVLKIPCEVTGIPEPVISWNQMEHGNKVVTSGNKITVYKNYILIKNPTEKDSSNFTCKAQNTYGIATATFEAIISDFIIWDEDHNTNIFLKPGESKDIECFLPHSDPQSVRWYVNGENTHVLGTFYSIKNAEFENDGNYTCRSNIDQESESLNYVVDVGYKPSFKNMELPSTYNWDGGKKEMLDCEVDAKPRVKVEWVYNGKPLNINEVGVPISGWGIYSCNVSNYHGSVQHIYNVTGDGCIINRTAERIQNTPLLIGDKPSTWPKFHPNFEFLTVSRNQKFILECSTQNQPQNTFKTHPTAKIINVECLNEDKFIVEEKTYKFEDLQCKDYVKPSQVLTKKTCMKNGKMIEIGFELNSGFLGVYEICYSDADHKTLFTKVVMSDVNIGNIVESSFKLNEGIKTGKKNDGEIIKCQYNQRWLVNPVDVAFGPAQTATLSKKFNSVPVYEPCGSSRMSWSDVEYAVQSLLLTMDTLTVWSGASNYNSQGIPLHLWKVIKYDDDTFDTIVYLNVAKADIDFVCPPIDSPSHIEVSDKYTYSCLMGDFVKGFNVPNSDFGLT